MLSWTYWSHRQCQQHQIHGNIKYVVRCILASLIDAFVFRRPRIGDRDATGKQICKYEGDSPQARKNNCHPQRDAEAFRSKIEDLSI